MRRLVLLLVIALSFGLQATSLALDLVEKVPADDPAYRQLALLAQRQLLSDGNESIQAGRELTRYDFGLQLIEPLERFIALVDAQETAILLPEQNRRKELAYQAVVNLSGKELDELVNGADSLLHSFRDVVEELAPGLSGRADTALRKLRLERFRPWIQEKGAGIDMKPKWHFWLEPKAAPDKYRNPLPLLPARGSDAALAMEAVPARLIDPETPLAGTKPINSLEAAVDVALGRLRVFGSLTTLPGQDLLEMVTDDGNGKAKLGFQYDFGRVKELGISGVFEYHILRGGEPGNPETNIGVAGGVGLSW